MFKLLVSCCGEPKDVDSHSWMIDSVQSEDIAVVLARYNEIIKDRQDPALHFNVIMVGDDGRVLFRFFEEDLYQYRRLGL